MTIRNRSFADFVTYWIRLLQATETNQPILPDLTQLKGALTGVVDELKVVTANQDAHRAGLQTETQRLVLLMVRGRDAAPGRHREPPGAAQPEARRVPHAVPRQAAGAAEGRARASRSSRPRGAGVIDRRRPSP